MANENMQAGETPEPEAPDDVHADVLSAWDELEAKESGIAPPPPQPYDRDPQTGRFIARSDQAQAPADWWQQHPTQAPMDSPSPANGASFYSAPGGWSDQAKAMFNQLPPQVQEAVAIREQQITQGFAKYQGLDQWVQHAQANNTTLPAVLNDYYNAHQLLATDIYSGIGELCRYFGYDPGQLVQRYLAEAQGGTYNVQQDPTINYLHQLSSQINGIQSRFEQQENEQINGELQAFAVDHPWLEGLRPYMALLLENGQANSLQEAYDLCAWAHPQTRQMLLDHYFPGHSNGGSPVPRRSNGRAPQAGSNSRGRSLNPGSPVPGASSQRTPKNTLREEIEAVWDELST